MNYCENCHVAVDEEACPLCGGKKLRLVKNDDFCLVTERKVAIVDELIIKLDEREIPYSLLPYGSGVESHFGIPLSNYRLFVPFSYFAEVKSLIAEIDNLKTEELRKPILQNLEKLNISPKLEKKIRKKAKLSEDTDIFEYIVNIIENSDKIINGGRDGVNLKSGGYCLYFYCGNLMLILNSATFEIISFSVQK